MKMTNFTLVNMMNVLQSYSDKKLPQKISFAITRNLMNISKEYGVYDAQLKKLFESYSDHMVKDDDGNMQTYDSGIPIVDESIKAEFDEQISELLNIEIEVDMYYIDPDVFDYDDKGIYDAMSAQDIMVLQSILCKQDNEEK